MALTFPSDGDKVVWSGGGILYNQTVATIMCWFKWPAAGTTPNYFIFDQFAAFNKQVRTYGGGNTNQHKINVAWRTPTASAIFAGAGNWDDDVWHRLGIVRRNSSPYVQLYVDGASDGSSVTNPTTDATAVSAQQWGGNTQQATDKFSGRLFRCAYVSGLALTPDQIDSFLFKGRLPNQALDLWFEMGLASPEPDWSGNGHSGTLTGTSVADNAPVGPAFGFD